jgi:hypothetical protein
MAQILSGGPLPPLRFPAAEFQKLANSETACSFLRRFPCLLFTGHPGAERSAPGAQDQHSPHPEIRRGPGHPENQALCSIPCPAARFEWRHRPAFDAAFQVFAGQESTASSFLQHPHICQDLEELFGYGFSLLVIDKHGIWTEKTDYDRKIDLELRRLRVVLDILRALATGIPRRSG